MCVVQHHQHWRTASLARRIAYQAGANEVDMLDLIEPGRKTVVLGNPGVGKSTLAIRLASALARNARDRRAVFVLVLRDLSARMSEGWSTLNDCLEHVARSPYHIDFSPAELEYVLLNGNVVVFIDGLDELIDLSQRANVIDLIEGFARAYPLVSMVVTSRHLGYGPPGSTPTASTIRAPRTASLDPRTFTKILIRQFNDDQVAGYANRWFAVARRTDSAGDLPSPLAASFLSESRSIADLRANPLLLSLLCTSYTRRQHIPRNRAEIYAQCSIMLFNQWDEDRGIPLQMRFRGWLRGAVRYLAWQMLEQGGQPELPRSLVERLLIRFLEEHGLHRDEAADEAEKFLKFCFGRAADDISSGEQSARATALAMAASLTHLINHRAFEHAFAWDDLAIKLAMLGSDIPLVPRTTHALPAMLSDIEPAQLDLLLKAAGPAPLFRFSLDLRHVIAPHALLAFSRIPREAADPDPVGVICEHLITAPRPWLDSKAWQEQCVEANIDLACQIIGPEPEQSKTRLAQYLILLLPYLETAALWDLSPNVGSTAGAFIRARALPTHAAFDIRVNLKAQIEHSLHGMPDHYAGYLRHWAERRFSVIGAHAV